jgi:hypothetical protein
VAFWAVPDLEEKSVAFEDLYWKNVEGDSYSIM